MKFFSSCLLFVGCFFGLLAAQEPTPPVNVSLLPSPEEDLMREHGILNRFLLIYDELSRRLKAQEPFPRQCLLDAVGLHRKYIEGFHERMEEEYVFPPFVKANQRIDLINTLIEQHRSGCQILSCVLAHSSEEELKDKIQSMVLAGYLDIFCRLFRPHETRETTYIFPAFRSMISPEAYEQLRVLFAQKENELFGANGYQNVLDDVERFEKQLNIFELPHYIPSM